MRLSALVRAHRLVAPLTVVSVLTVVAVSSTTADTPEAHYPAGGGTSTAVGVADVGTGEDAVVDEVPVYIDTPCAEYARSEAVDQTTTNKWMCIGDVLTTTDSGTNEQRNEVLNEDGEVQGPATRDDLRHASEVAEIEGTPTSAGQLQLVDRVDDYHAKKSVGIAWNTGAAQGWVNYSYNIAISNHSADVAMSYFETTDKPIIMTWKLRLRHDITLGGDTTKFTYPNVEGPSYYTRSYNYTEGRYGDGYNTLPYESDWKMFWDTYKISIRHAAINVNSDNTAQSDRVTCYKTVSCKFK